MKTRSWNFSRSGRYDVVFRCVFNIDVYWFWMDFSMFFWLVFVLKVKTSCLWKLAFRLDGSDKIKGSRGQKTTKKSQKIDPKLGTKNDRKKAEKNETKEREMKRKWEEKEKKKTLKKKKKREAREGGTTQLSGLALRGYLYKGILLGVQSPAFF